MEVQLFPFELVEKNSRIIVYGYGDLGHQFFLQINKFRYCEILYFVDRNYAEYQDAICKVVSVEYLCVEPPEQYDKILVAIDNPAVSEKIKLMLCEAGIPSEKIITLNQTRFMTEYNWKDGTAMLSEKIWNDENSFRQYIFNQYDFFKYRLKTCWEYFPELQKLLESASEKRSLLAVLKKQMVAMPNHNGKIALLQLLCIYDVFDSDCMQWFVEALLAANKDDITVYGLSMDTSFIIFHHPEYLYNEFYNGRRLLLKKLAEKITYELPRVQLCHEKKGVRVAILCYCALQFVSSAYFALFSSYALQLNKAGAEVNIFSSNSLKEDNLANTFLMKSYRFTSGMFYSEKIKETGKDLENQNIRIWESDSENPFIRERYVIEKVLSYQPDVIIDMSDEVAVATYHLQKYFPIVYFPMRGYLSSSFFDLAITQSNKICKERNKKYNAISENQMYELKLGNLPKRQEIVNYQREQFGFCDLDFIIITVGARLQFEIHTDLLIEVCSLLVKEKQMKWILVGERVENDFPEFQKLISAGQIIQWGEEKYLESLYRICNVYLQPNRNGGGVSIRQAMREGLPIALTNYPSDVLSRFSEEDVVYGNYGDLMAFISRLYRDPELYQKCSNRMLEIIDSLSPENDAKKVLDVCKYAVEKFGPTKEKY